MRCPPFLAAPVRWHPRRSVSCVAGRSGCSLRARGEARVQMQTVAALVGVRVRGGLVCACVGRGPQPDEDAGSHGRCTQLLLVAALGACGDCPPSGVAQHAQCRSRWGPGREFASAEEMNSSGGRESSMSAAMRRSSNAWVWASETYRGACCSSSPFRFPVDFRFRDPPPPSLPALLSRRTRTDTPTGAHERAVLTELAAQFTFDEFSFLFLILLPFSLPLLATSSVLPHSPSSPSILAFFSWLPPTLLSLPFGGRLRPSGTDESTTSAAPDDDHGCGTGARGAREANRVEPSAAGKRQRVAYSDRERTREGYNNYDEKRLEFVLGCMIVGSPRCWV
ncbi:hypothetical protein B0H19DRAFT_1240623 [Mycena capillaripes]|nr:hypothetical protein B0H19DRAFT_1240623 [Mycena capillaripes]